MKLEIDRDLLFPLLSRAAGTVPCSDAQPILKNFHIRVRQNKLQVMSTDMMAGSIAEIAVMGADDGEICVPSGKFLEIVKTAPKGRIQMTLLGRQMTVRGGFREGSIPEWACQWIISCMPTDLFPEFPVYNDETAQAASREELAAKLGLVSLASPAENDSNLNLMAIYVDNDKMYAADGKRACRVHFKSSWQNVTLPSPSIPLIVKTLKASKVNEVKLCKLKHHYVLKLGNDLLHIRMIEAKFPDIEKAVFEDTDKYLYRLKLDRKEFIGAIKRAAITSEDSLALCLNVVGSTFSISTSNTLNDAYHENVPAEWNGTNFTRWVNYEHLLEALSILKDDKIEIRLEEDMQMKKSRYRLDEGDLSIVILPLRLKSIGKS